MGRDTWRRQTLGNREERGRDLDVDRHILALGKYCKRHSNSKCDNILCPKKIGVNSTTITYKEVSAQDDALKVLKAQWRKINRERNKHIREKPFQPFAKEDQWDDLRIAWNVSKSEEREVKYKFKVLEFMVVLQDTLRIFDGKNSVLGLEAQLEITNSEQKYFIRALREMEDQGTIKINREACPDVSVPGSQETGLKEVPGHGDSKVICGQCRVELL